MQFSDEGIVINSQKYGEKYIILKLFSCSYGVKSALINNSKKSFSLTQVGNVLEFSYSGRENFGLGFFKAEVKKDVSLNLILSAIKLMAISSAAAIIEKFLPQEDSHTNLFKSFMVLIDASKDDDKLFLSKYALFEKDLLKEIGFGLDLEKCALSGRRDNLFYISPTSGSAVGKDEGEFYKEKLFYLNNLLRLKDIHSINNNTLKNIDFKEIYETVKTTRFFLFKILSKYQDFGKKLPEICNLFLDKLGKLNA